MFSEGHGGHVRGLGGSKFRSRWAVSGLQGSSLVGVGVLGCWNRGSRRAAAPGKGAPCCSSLRPGRGVSCHLERGPRMGAQGGACRWGPAPVSAFMGLPDHGLHRTRSGSEDASLSRFLGPSCTKQEQKIDVCSWGFHC